jgi:hypothetical protein
MSNKFHIWKYIHPLDRRGPWMVQTPETANTYQFPTWQAAMGFVENLITGKQRGRR